MCRPRRIKMNLAVEVILVMQSMILFALFRGCLLIFFFFFFFFGGGGVSLVCFYVFIYLFVVG